MTHSKKHPLYELIQEKILVLDGAMGTMLQNENLTADDFGGKDLEGCNENLVYTRPDIVQKIHRAYLESGSDIIETNTFGATPLVLDEYQLKDKALEVNQIAAKLAKEAANKFSTSEKPRFVAGSMGPTTKAISVTGGVTFDELIENFLLQATGLIDGGVDLLLLETCQDTRNIKAGLIGIQKAFDQTAMELPIIVSGTIEPMGTMLAGQASDALVASLKHAPLFAIGLNCATGPEFMTDHIRTIHELNDCAVSCYPNAGLPNEEGEYLETPESLAKQLDQFVKKGWINLIGGCCGTTADHIRAIAQMAEGQKPRVVKKRTKGRSFYSGIELVEATDDNRPLLVGERTNVIGSRKFKDLVNAEEWDQASDIARRQVKNGAHVIDVCLQSTDRDELPDIDPFYDQLIRKIKAPIMIDTTDPAALEKALTYSQGHAIINSINLEEGLDRFDAVVPLLKKYGASVVVGTIDEDPHQAQAFTRERKLEIAERSHKILTNDYGLAEETLIFDPLVFPCATGDENYIGGAVETIEGLRLIKEKLPFCKTTLGVSNISFGLPNAAREVVNSVFLYHAVKAGLDLAIVNTEKLERFALIDDHEKKLAENLLFNQSDDPKFAKDWREQTKAERFEINQKNIAQITEHFRKNQNRPTAKPKSSLSLDERLNQYIIEGTKDGLVADLDLKLKEAKPLDIINGPLMDGMKEVGRLFNNNELIVAEVLQSAEAMKASVTHLEQFMEKADVVSKGKILLATVKGDVHDIGKNLVEIILANNGYEVINLGIKIPPEQIIQAYREHKPDMIGLSGLLVKSAQQMIITAADLKAAGIEIPILVGGAALSDKFTRNKIAPSYQNLVLYAKDAMTGLKLANQIMDEEELAKLVEELKNEKENQVKESQQKKDAPNYRSQTKRAPEVNLDVTIPNLPYADLKTRDIPQLDTLFSYINPQMLYVKHLGFKGNFSKKLKDRDPKALKLYDQVEELKNEVRDELKVKARWQFFNVQRDQNNICFFDQKDIQKPTPKPIATLNCIRQNKPDGLCLSDYVLKSLGDKEFDQVAFFVVTAGEKIRQKAESYKAAGEFFKMHALYSLALETAEGAAEWLHERLRQDWGFADDQVKTKLDLFQARYRGLRYSFGYPACPDLEDQKLIWQLLKPEEIGVELTLEMMMDPEASVSALVFHHPDCRYFSVGEDWQNE